MRSNNITTYIVIMYIIYIITRILFRQSCRIFLQRGVGKIDTPYILSNCRIFRQTLLFRLIFRQNDIHCRIFRQNFKSKIHLYSNLSDFLPKHLYLSENPTLSAPLSDFPTKLFPQSIPSDFPTNHLFLSDFPTRFHET